MGLFNRIWVDCPDCGSSVEFQSKSGDCTLADYHISHMPTTDLAGIIGDVEECRSCGNTVSIGEPRESSRFENFSNLVQ